MDNLIEKLERADGPDRELDADIAKSANVQLGACFCTGACDPKHVCYKGACVAVPAYTSSIDAALTLAEGDAIERVGGAIGILNWAIDMMQEACASIDALPRFIVIAALKAMGASPTTGEPHDS